MLSSSCSMRLSFVITLQSLPLPNEDFGRPNEPFRVRFRSTFQAREHARAHTLDHTHTHTRTRTRTRTRKHARTPPPRIVEKCFESALGTVRSVFQNLRLGSIKLQKNIASQKTQHITSSHLACYYLFTKIVASCDSIPWKPTRRIACYYLCIILQT